MDWLRILGVDERLRAYRRVAADTAAAAEDRFELFAIEWQEEKQRIGRMVVLGVVSAVLAIVALTVFSMAIMVHFWDTAIRVQAAWTVALAWLILVAGLLFALFRTAQGSRDAFVVTRQELARDWTELKEHL